MKLTGHRVLVGCQWFPMLSASLTGGVDSDVGSSDACVRNVTGEVKVCSTAGSAAGESLCIADCFLIAPPGSTSGSVVSSSVDVVALPRGS